jgi:hypothetical protein
LDTAELTVRTLAQAGSTHTAAVHAAAECLRPAQAAWQQIVVAWTDLATDTSQVATRSNAEASDLVLRMGRLAFDNPGWQPTREHHKSPPRPVHKLAPDDPACRTVIGAVHQAVDALAALAAADFTGVTAAHSAGRFYVATRTLDGCDIPRRFAMAPVQRITGLLAKYQAAAASCSTAAHRLGDLAIAATAPSHVIAHARKAAGGYQNDALPTEAGSAGPDLPGDRLMSLRHRPTRAPGIAGQDTPDNQGAAVLAPTSPSGKRVTPVGRGDAASPGYARKV